ncbi:MAG: hypothetical protein WHS83_06005 [Chloroflexus sp.]|uniref:NACHT domain-containing protein n=1 Tax=Chloroflexus sp. TaxID=1904827 RepID=UPI0030B1AE71
MTELNWDNFTRLPGSAEKNFELLCRGIVRLNFGGYGVFRALANQPGVEFHLKLDKRSEALGDPGRWWGWQCKWYELGVNGCLGANRRRDIEDSIRKSEAHVPGLTDWVLWTRRPLTKGDQEWFYGLSSNMSLHLWTEEEVENLLSGQAAILRSTYFGELVLTPETLADIHKQAVAPIRKRWLPDVHRVREAERELRRMLGETASWNELQELSADLHANAQILENTPPDPPPLAPSVANVVAAARNFAEILDSVATHITNGDLDLLGDEINKCARTLPADVATTLRKLRSCNHPAALYATNAVAGCREAIRLLDDIERAFSSRVVAILAPAGCGKTHLAAQLTSETPTRPNGVLLYGRDLHANHTLDDLARRISIAAQPVPSMEALLAAVNAAGQRARHRLPVVIDGLNEAEDPRQWKPMLASLETMLSKYPHVLLVCTLRTVFANDALPDETRRVEIADYGEETIEAIREHFRYWKIDAQEGILLLDFLRHPLTLRLFCEVTNPNRQQTVSIQAMPGSLTELFERYLNQVSERIVELAPRTYRFCAQNVNDAISTIANRLWETKARSIELRELRDMLGDAQRPWDQSIVRALEHEGILLRMPSNGIDAFVPVYDLLGGHIIARALLAKHGQDSFEKWIAEPETTSLLAGSYDVRHPLAEDILRSLTEQLPRRFYAKQLWQLVDEPLRDRALRWAAHLEAKYLDAITVEALIELVRAGDTEILEWLRQVRGMSGHPLNAEGLDRALRTMTVADRDLRWTEWLRKNYDTLMGRVSILRDLEHLDHRWRSGKVLRTEDRLRARWVMWTLTSTIRRLRDQATRALYWFGRHDPQGLFSLTIDSLTVNDPYVSERMLAASYGVVMSHQGADADFAAYLKLFLEQLATALVGPSATAPTHHYLVRRYVRGIVLFAAKFYPDTLPTVLRDTWTFAAPPPNQPLNDSEGKADEVRRTLHMDFKNYTLGSLFDDRQNYDMSHAGHQAAIAHVLEVVWALGWRRDTFDALDRQIAEKAYRDRGDRPSIERYGKKYGWIGFYTYAGILEDQGLLPRERSFIDADIDPSFPEKPPIDGYPSMPDAWLFPTIKDHERWIRTCKTTLPLSIVRREEINGHRGPWLAVHGHLSVLDRILGREVWAFLSALVVSRKQKARLMDALKAGERPWSIRDVPRDYYTFAGEIPWHPGFASEAIAENAYYEHLRVGTQTIKIEILAHEYAWESYHSKMNRAGVALVPSQPFSVQFDLRGAPQTFNQFLPDGSPATLTLSGVDGLGGKLLYIREDLLRQYAGERAIVWFVFGERKLLPYPSSPPGWLMDALQQGENAWSQVFCEV